MTAAKNHQAKLEVIKLVTGVAKEIFVFLSLSYFTYKDNKIKVEASKLSSRHNQVFSGIE